MTILQLSHLVEIVQRWRSTLQPDYKERRWNRNWKPNSSIFLTISFYQFIYFSLGICLAGKYSTNNGVCPCKRCPYGTYQENEQMTTCKACPTGTTTTYTGSKSISDCVGKFTNNLYHLCPEHREMWSKAIWLWLQRHGCPDWPDSHVISVTRFPLNSAFLANVN